MWGRSDSVTAEKKPLTRTTDAPHARRRSISARPVLPIGRTCARHHYCASSNPTLSTHTITIYSRPLLLHTTPPPGALVAPPLRAEPPCRLSSPLRPRPSRSPGRHRRHRPSQRSNSHRRSWPSTPRVTRRVVRRRSSVFRVAARIDKGDLHTRRQVPAAVWHPQEVSQCRKPERGSNQPAGEPARAHRYDPRTFDRSFP